MKTNVKQMKCGGCGGELFKVFTPDPKKEIIVECQQCKSTSGIIIQPPILEICWGEKATGCLTVF